MILFQRGERRARHGMIIRSDDTARQPALPNQTTWPWGLTKETLPETEGKTGREDENLSEKTC